MSTAATPLRVSVAIAAVTALAVTIGLALAGANVARSAAEGISSIDVWTRARYSRRTRPSKWIPGIGCGVSSRCT